MYKNLIGWFTAIIFFQSCAGNSPDISVVCEENKVGNHIIKWELTPVIEGKVAIYASTNPDRIPLKKAVASADISDQWITIVTSDPTQRFYYKLVFNNQFEKVVGSRNVNIPGVRSFRDIGGTTASREKEIKWGKLYRAGDIGDIPYSSYKKLRNMGIKTIIDLRTASEIEESGQTDTHSFNIINIPIDITNTNDILRELRDGKIKNDSIYRLMMRINRDLVTYYRKEYRKIFDVLLQEENYPLVIQCTTGKGRTAIASALLLSALGVSEHLIMSDYQLSNNYFNIPNISSFAYKLSPSSQEAITTLYSARKAFLSAALQQIEKNYGDVDTYLYRGIGLTNDEIKQLKNILLH